MRKLTYKRMLHMLLAFLIAIGGLTTLDGITAMAAEGDVFTTDTAEGVTVTYKVLTEDTVNSTGTVQVGKGLAGETAIPPDYTGTVTIPSTVNHGGTTYTVVGIAYKAMYNCDLTSVNLPNTILSIGAYAFNATGITQIELPHSLLVIDGYAFAYCGSLTTVTVPQGVINIGGGAFNGCSTLNSAVLPDSITALPDYLFQDCTSLASVTLGSQVETIRYRTFYNCSVLTEITLPASLAEIRSDAFRDCSSLANIYFDGNAPNLSGTNQFNGVASPAYGNVYETAANFPFIGQDYYGLTIRQRGNNAQKPLITDLSSALAVSVGNGASLTVMASVLDEGILSFQWYENSVKQNTGGSPISGATGFSYVLPTDTAGVKYYYVTVTNTNTGVSGEQTAVTVSAPITVTVYETTDAETPVITAQPADTTVNQETVILSVNVEPLSDGGTLSYAWYENTADSYSGGVFVGEESSVIASYLGVRYYYVIVTNTNNSVSGDKTASVTSDIARVTIHPLINAQEPEITAQPQEQNVSVGDPVTLSATSISLDGGELSYQWYVNNFSSTSGATELPGSVQSSYSPSTSEFGTNYYFVVITNTNNDLSGIKSAQITSDIAMVNVSKTSYTITVENDSNGTAGANPNPAVAGQTVQLGYLADSGYQFKEWQVISGDINILPNNTFMMPASAVTVKAIFEDIPDYTISVSDDGHGNGSAEPAAADAGVTVTISAFNSPSYIFKEWQVISGGVTLASTTAMTTTFIMPDSNVEVKAIFENVTPGVYTLNLLSSTGGTVGCDGGSGLTSATNALVNLWTTPDTDYVFKEWELLSGTFDISNITKASDNWYQFMMPPSHLVLKAVFESTAPASYTVTFDANGGSGSMSDQTFTEGVAQTLTANAFTLMDYSFDGWATSPTGSVVYSEGQSVTISADTTLYAVWNATGPASYTVTFDANGGSGSMSDQTFTEGVAQTLTANAFTLTDYSFDGWATSPTGSVVYADGDSVIITENTTLYAIWNIDAPPAFTGTISEMETSNVGLGDTIYLGSYDGAPLAWRVVSGSGSSGAMTLLAVGKAGDTTEFDRDPDGSGPGTTSNNYRDSDIREYLNNIFANCLNGIEKSSVIKVRTFDAATGVSISNAIADEAGDYSYVPNESQIITWNNNAPGTNKYWASYWVRDPDISPYEGYYIPAGGGGGMRVFLTSQFAPRPAVVINTSGMAFVSEIVVDNTGRPWALQADGTNYATATSGKAYMIGIGYPVDLNITGIPTTAQITVGSALTLSGISPSINDGSATLVYTIYKKSDGSIVQYERITASSLSSITLNAAGITPGSGYAVRVWLQKNTVNHAPALSPFYNFDLEITDAAPPTTYAISVTGGTADKTTAEEGETITVTANAPSTGKQFSSWMISPSVTFADSTSATSVIAKFIMPAEEVTATATYKDLLASAYLITVETNGNGMANANFNSAVASTEITLTVMPDNGYRFKEWQVNSGGVTIMDNKFTMPDENVEVTAIFEPLPVYTVTFDANGGSCSTATAMTDSTGKLSSLPTATRSGYSFNGWYSTVTGGTRITSSTVFSANATVFAYWTSSDSSGGTSRSGGTSGHSSNSETPTLPVNLSIDSKGGVIAHPKIDAATGKATVNIDNNMLNTALNRIPENSAGNKTVDINVPPMEGAAGFEISLPSDVLSERSNIQLRISTAVATVTLTGDMLAQGDNEASKIAALSVKKIDASQIGNEETRRNIGDRPVIQLTLTLDGKQTDWNNPQAPVTVTIPYVPTAEELANPESIVIWYIDGNGNVISVPKGYYDPAAGSVTFTTTHFSDYAVSYNKVSFNDVAVGAWYCKAVNFIAAREITSGTGSGRYSPDARLTRGEFIVLLMRAYDIEPDANPTDNFTDAANTYYTNYLAAAKRLGISAGVGNNMYAPGREISRQEMFALLYNALRAIEQLPEDDSGKTLASFTDRGNISSWATEAMMLLVKARIVSGSGNMLNPTGTTTRAEMAQVLYNLLGSN